MNLLLRFQPKIIPLLLLVFLLFKQVTSLHAQTREALRYEIDAKRAGIGYTSKDALPRGREFKRLDSTYYVGWMLEGGYKFEHAADFLGFKMAADQLSRALNLLEKDFKKELRTRTSDVFAYLPVMKYQRDWDFMAYALMQCYSNTEETNKLWALLQRCKRTDLQLEAYTETYNYMAWTVHRNRFYTSEKFPFLKNTIDENEQYANRLLDSSIRKIRRDAELNKTIFTADYEKEKMPGVWHYKSILYSYQLNVESGAYYYEKLRSTPYFPQNNYATFCMIQGKFEEAERYYKLAKEDEPGDKRMKESYYYSSMLNAYRNENKKGIEELNSLVKAKGSTPGFGWYQIALTRNLLYDGQLEQAHQHANKAEQFKEIHIGTTLGQSHYDFSISLLNLMLKIREIEKVKFLNKNWWYTPADLGRLAQLTVEKYGLQFLIINQFASNPERDRVVYKLFSTESTVSFDEVWHLIDGFSINYFLEKYRKELSTDKRPQIKRYFQLMAARLLIKKEDYGQAMALLDSARADKGLNPAFEKLFLARCLESEIICLKAKKQNTLLSEQLIQAYQLYPQLLPFGEERPAMRLHADAKNPTQTKLLAQLSKANIPWTSQASAPALDVFLDFYQVESFPMVRYQVKLGDQTLLPPKEFTYKNPELAGRQVAMALFGIGQYDMPKTANSDKEGNLAENKGRNESTEP